MTIFLDMDGTIANLYEVEEWLPRLRSYDARIYREARPMCDMRMLARRLNRIQKKGIKIGIISWGSKDKSPEFLEAVKAEKLRWLRSHLKSVNFDEIHIVEYGTSKTNFRTSDNDILFDDEENNIKEWGYMSFYPQYMERILKDFVK